MLDIVRLATEVSDLKCDFTAINDEANVQDFAENGYECAGLQQPIDIRQGSSCNC